MEVVVISIGGSVLFSDAVTEIYFKQLNTLLQNLSEKYKFYIIVGGGKKARHLIKKGREEGLSEEELDQIGIDVTRENAEALSDKLENSNIIIPKLTDEAKAMPEKIIVMGGTTPGHSTDMVGAELAQKTNASKFIIATNVDGIYDKDPNQFSDAKKYNEITINELVKQHGTDWKTAGKNTVIDGPALDIIQKAKIPTFVLNGKNLDELEKVITNQKFNGTKIKN
jgi:uridylate kinase